MKRSLETCAARNKSGVLRRTFILEPLTQTTDGDTGDFSDGSIGVLEPILDDGPDFVHERSRHVLIASFNADSKRKDGTVAWVWLSEVLDNEGAESGEDLSGGQVGGESIDDAQSGLANLLILGGNENQRE